MGYVNVVKNSESGEIKLPSDAVLGTEYCDVNRGILSMYPQDSTTPNSGISYPITIPEIVKYSDTLEIIIPITVFAPIGNLKDRCIFSFSNSSTFTAAQNYLWVDTYQSGGNYRLVYIDQNGSVSTYNPFEFGLGIGKSWLKFVFSLNLFRQDQVSLYKSTDGTNWTNCGAASFGYGSFNASNFDTITFGDKSNGSQYIGTYGLNASIDLSNCSATYNAQKLRDFVVR